MTAGRLAIVLLLLVPLSARAQPSGDGDEVSDEIPEDWVEGPDPGEADALAEERPNGGGEDDAERDGNDDADGDDVRDDADGDVADEDGKGDAGAVEGDEASDDALVRVAEGLMDLGRYDEACPKLEQALEGDPAGTTALLLAECREREGRIASAWAAYEQAAGMLGKAGDSRASEARRRAAAIEPRVPELLIEATAPVEGMQIWRNGTRYGAAILDVPVAVDPGEQRIEVRADGYRPWSTRVHVAASERRRVEIPALEKTGVAPSAPSSGRGPLFTAGLLVTGVGFASVAGGAILGIAAARDVRTAESDPSLCGPERQCTEAGLSLVERAGREALGSTVMLAVGGAAVLGGLGMLIFPEDTAVVPAAGPDGAFLELHMRF